MGALRLRGRGGGELGQVGQGVDVNSVGSLLSLVSHVHPLLASDQVDQLVAVLADDHRSKKFAFIFSFCRNSVLTCSDRRRRAS